MKVYVVQEDHWSGGRISAVFTDAERAERIASLYGENVEEFDVDTFEVPPGIPDGMLPHVVHMARDGKNDGGAFVEMAFPEKFQPRWLPWGDWHVEFFVWAADRANAVALANEWRLLLLEGGEWMPDWKAWHAERGTK